MSRGHGSDTGRGAQGNTNRTWKKTEERDRARYGKGMRVGDWVQKGKRDLPQWRVRNKRRKRWTMKKKPEERCGGLSVRKEKTPGKDAEGEERGRGSGVFLFRRVQEQIRRLWDRLPLYRTEQTWFCALRWCSLQWSHVISVGRAEMRRSVRIGRWAQTKW